MTPLDFFFVFVFLLSFFLQPFLTYGDFCPNVSCGNVSVDFPFRLTNQPDCCGDPNFNLLCTTTNQTIISFPFSGDFMVNTINYSNPYLQLTDPCITKRLLQRFNLSCTPFQPLYTRTYIFSNCSTDSNISVFYPSALLFSCLSSINFSVWGIAKSFYDPWTPVSSCVELAEISVPQHDPGWPFYFDDIPLTWKQPYCHTVPCNYCPSSELSGKEGGIYVSNKTMFIEFRCTTSCLNLYFLSRSCKRYRIRCYCHPGNTHLLDCSVYYLLQR